MAERVEAIDLPLDSGYGRRDLARPQVAALVQDALLRFDGERYALIARCVAPHHVHAPLETFSGVRLDRVVHSWKSFTAHAAKRSLGRAAGAFLGAGYVDRYMRDDGHLAGTQACIEANPVKAGLCAEPSEWPFSSARHR